MKEAGLVPSNLNDVDTASAYPLQQQSGKNRKSQSRSRSTRRAAQARTTGQTHFLSSERAQSPRPERMMEGTPEPKIHQGIRHQQALEQKKEIKTRLKHLFMNYCDFNYETSQPFISQTSF